MACWRSPALRVLSCPDLWSDALGLQIYFWSATFSESRFLELFWAFGLPGHYWRFINRCKALAKEAPLRHEWKGPFRKRNQLIVWLRCHSKKFTNPFGYTWSYPPPCGLGKFTNSFGYDYTWSYPPPCGLGFRTLAIIIRPAPLLNWSTPFRLGEFDHLIKPCAIRRTSHSAPRSPVRSSKWECAMQ